MKKSDWLVIIFLLLLWGLFNYFDEPHRHTRLDQQVHYD